MSGGIVFQTDLGEVKLLRRGKVRDIYDLGDRLLIIATDRISAFDVVLPTGIPDKGRVLTKISLFWFKYLADVVQNHLLSADPADYPEELGRYTPELEGRSMMVKKAEPFPVECVVRGYLSGSGWNEYLKSGEVCGVPLPEGLSESAPLAEPIFTPATKEEVGAHDINISFREMAGITGWDVARRLRDYSLGLYRKAAEYALTRGIIIADTKFEFGRVGNSIILIDEVLTPDSSRFWPAGTYESGRPQESFDKQYVRDYLLTLEWDRRAPGPDLPADVVAGTSRKYREALSILTGEGL